MITKDDIKKLSYPDFVGLINQWNVPPWSYDTLSRWINYWKINEKSNILEVACTTGFSLREICDITWAKWLWFDLSNKAIENANYNKEKYSHWANLEFIQADWYEFESKWKKFTHIIVWWALKFFPDPDKMMEKVVSFLEDRGILLASPFYGIWNMPDSLKQKARKIFGFNITSEPYKEIMSLYNKLEILHEERKKLELETDEEIKNYCKSTIDLAVSRLWIGDKDVYNAMFDRLYEIRQMSNELRTYQEYCVLVLRYRKSLYPNRLVELF